MIGDMQTWTVIIQFCESRKASERPVDDDSDGVVEQ